MSASTALPCPAVGRAAWVFGDDFDVDEIVGIDNIRTFDLDVLRAACMAGFDPDFTATVRPGDWLVAGSNFGYGHPHDQPMLVMRALGVVGVIAGSFAPLFVRGEAYNGFPLVTCPGAADSIRRGDDLVVDWKQGQVEVVRTRRVLVGAPLSTHRIAQIEAGGGQQLLAARLGERSATETGTR